MRRGTAERGTEAPHGACWAGLATSDPDAAKAFYVGLFGWRTEDLAEGRSPAFTVLRLGNDPVAILYPQTAQARAAGVSPHWTIFISVEDVDADRARTTELGGAVVRGPFDIPDTGRAVAIRDPLGAILTLWQAHSRVASGPVKGPGSLGWSELATSDVDRASSFYGELLGWRFEIGEAGYANAKVRASIRPPAPQARDTAPSWFPYFTVHRVDVAAGEAKRLGGRRWVREGSEATWTGSALIADPQGAEFGLLAAGNERP